MSEILAKAVRQSEDVAVGLISFRNAIPEDSACITSIIGKIYEITSLFTRLDRASQHPKFAPSFFRVKEDVLNVVYSMQATNRLALDTFGRTSSLSFLRVWDDLTYRMATDERVSFDRRLDWYKGSLLCSIAVLKEHPCPGRDGYYDDINGLLRDQQSMPGQFGTSASPRYVEEPTSPSVRSDGSRGTYPWAPEPPLMSPISSSSSRDTYESSQTSFSALGFNATPPATHWTKNIFDGRYASTNFHRQSRSPDATRCEGPTMPDAITRLSEDGFQPAVEIKFEGGDVRVHFFHRLADNRARILYISPGRQVHCAALTNLRIVRDKSCLKLCHVISERQTIDLRLWANLNFVTFERMCLFYSTFVAMKRQDRNGIADAALFEDDELRENEPFGGKIKDGDMIHALRIRKDAGSGVIRIEATPYRGPMAGVPLWTAFVTKYRNNKDIDWAAHEGRGVVSLAALKPEPYVFMANYKPQHRNKEWLLRFVDVEDAKEFVTTWTKLCRQAD